MNWTHPSLCGELCICFVWCNQPAVCSGVLVAPRFNLPLLVKATKHYVSSLYLILLYIQFCKTFIRSFFINKIVNLTYFRTCRNIKPYLSLKLRNILLQKHGVSVLNVTGLHYKGPKAHTYSKNKLILIASYKLACFK